MDIFVKNIKGSQGEHYRDIGLADWMKAKGVKTKPVCQIFGCTETAKDGAHVLVYGSDKHWFILPTCHAHNEVDDEWLKTKSTAAGMLVPLTAM